MKEKMDANIVVHNSSKISELITKLQHKEIDPAILGKDELQKIAWRLRSTGSSYTDIAELVGKDERTIRRYIKDERGEVHELEIGETFQKDIIMDFVCGCNAQYQHLLRILYVGDLPPQEQMKVVMSMHLVSFNKIKTLASLGCISNGTPLFDGFDKGVEETNDLMKDAWLKEYARFSPGELLVILTAFQKDKGRVVKEFHRIYGDMTKAVQMMNASTPPENNGDGKKVS